MRYPASRVGLLTLLWGEVVDKNMLATLVTASCGRLAQLGEHRPYKPRVTGSSPVPPTIRISSLSI